MDSPIPAPFLRPANAEFAVVHREGRICWHRLFRVDNELSQHRAALKVSDCTVLRIGIIRIRATAQRRVDGVDKHKHLGFRDPLRSERVHNLFSARRVDDFEDDRVIHNSQIQIFDRLRSV